MNTMKYNVACVEKDVDLSIQGVDHQVKEKSKLPNNILLGRGRGGGGVYNCIEMVWKDTF